MAPGTSPGGTVLLDTLLKLGQQPAPEAVSAALRASEPRELSARPASVWLKGLAKARRPHVAVAALRALQALRCEVNVFHYSAVISACEKLGEWSMALDQLLEMSQARISADTIVCNAAISACARGGQWAMAVQLLGRMADSKVSKDTISYNSAITACEKSWQWAAALDLVEGMAAAKVGKDTITYNSLISACSKCQQWQLSLHLLRGMSDAKVQKDKITYSSAITSCDKQGQWLVALDLLTEMEEAKVLPDTITYTASISSCEKGEAWQVALSLFRRMGEESMRRDAITYNSVISACAKGGQWALALHLIGAMAEARVTKDTISYNAAISACDKAERWSVAMDLLASMADAKVATSTKTYNAAMSALSKSRQWELALHLLGTMPSVRVERDFVTFSVASEACEKAGQSGLALELLDARLGLGEESGLRPRMRRAPLAPRSFLAHLDRLGLKTLELRRLLRACARPSRKSFRINSIKAQPDLLARLKAEGWQMSPVPWHSDGFFVEAAPAGDLLGRSRPHLTGEIYFQEATSMLPGEVLRAVLSTLEVSSSRRLRVLDACAAPGSKSTQLGNWLEGQEGLLVANEADPVRAEILRTNLLRAGVVNCLVTCSDGRDLGDLAPELFDAVLMDVPCSCEGNARKDPGSLLRGSGGAPSNDGTPPIWHRSLVEKQWELIRSGWRALRPGGYLVYSTCTFNQWENEAQCMKLLEADAATELGGFRASAVDIAAVLNFPPSAASAVRGIAPLPSEKAQGQRSKGQTQISPESARLGVQLGALRLSPQSFDVEGFFVSCFRKEGSTGAHEEFFGTRSKPAASASTAMAPSYASDLRPLSASEVVKLRSLAQSCLGFWPESESESKKTKSNLWEDPRSGEIWLLPDLGPPGLEVLARHAKAPGLLVARRGRCSDPASRLELSDELMLVAGDRVGSAAGLSTSEWAELLSRVESGRHISPGRSERIGNMVAEETVDEEEEDVIGY